MLGEKTELPAPSILCVPPPPAAGDSPQARETAQPEETISPRPAGFPSARHHRYLTRVELSVSVSPLWLLPHKVVEGPRPPSEQTRFRFPSGENAETNLKLGFGEVTNLFDQSVSDTSDRWASLARRHLRSNIDPLEEFPVMGPRKIEGFPNMLL